MSDLHLEFGLDLPARPEDPKTVLILAGDIGLAVKKHTYMTFLDVMSNYYEHVIYIMGNHEFYRGSLLTGFDQIRSEASKFNNVYVVENSVIILGETAFICATLWTDFNKLDPIAILAAKELNDYKVIRTGTIDNPHERKIEPLDLIKLHKDSVGFIFESIAKYKLNGYKTVVVTHHGPSGKSIHPIYFGDPQNWSFVSELGDRIADCGPDIWIHGHTHHSFDYIIGNTRVVCNPRGYQHELNLEFMPEKILEI